MEEHGDTVAEVKKGSGLTGPDRADLGEPRSRLTAPGVASSSYTRPDVRRQLVVPAPVCDSAR